MKNFICQQLTELKDELLGHIQGYAPLLEEEMEVSEVAILSKRIEVLQKSHSAAIKQTKKEVDRVEALTKYPNCMHRKLFEQYQDVNELLADVQQEALEGAPGPWDSLGSGDGIWEVTRASETIHFIINKVYECAK